MDNSFPKAQFGETSFTEDRLIAGPTPILSKKVTLLSGENIVRGTVLGKVTYGAATPAAYAGNTGGSGTIGAVTTGAGTKVGVYNLVCIEPGTNAGKFTVEDPDGITVGVATVAVAFSGGGLGFTISDATDFVAGDGFTITVAAGSGKYRKAASANTDGSAAPVAIAASDVDATAGDKELVIYTRGDFNEQALTFGTGVTAVSSRDALKALDLFLITPEA